MVLNIFIFRILSLIKKNNDELEEFFCNFCLLKINLKIVFIFFITA